MYISRLFAALFSLSLLVTPFVTFAQTPFSAPQINAQAMRLNKSTYAQGEVVSGKFVITNSTDAAATNVIYVIRVVGGYDASGMWTHEYVHNEVAPFVLDPREARVIQFSIELPAGLAGQLGIEAQAKLGSGMPLGWTESRITVSGTDTFPTIESSSVVIGEDTFQIGEGPTIHPGQQAELVSVFKNNADTPLTLTPSLTHTRATGDVHTSSAPSFTIDAHATKEVRIPVVYNSAPAGVYVANISFLDENKRSHAPLLSYRYIIRGDAIATIHSLATDRTSGIRGDTVQVTVNMSGMPPDINPVAETANPTELGAMTLTVGLFNERGLRIGSAQTIVNTATETTKTVPVSLTGMANAFGISATLSKDGAIVATLTTGASADYANKFETAHLVLYGLYLLTVVFVIIGVILLIQGRNARMEGTGGRRTIGIGFLAIGILCALAAGALLLGFFSTPAAHAEGYEKDYYCNTNPSACYGGNEMDGGEITVYVDPDLCPYDDGVQTTGPCTNGLMNLNYVSDNVLWDSYIRTYLPQWTQGGGYWTAGTVSSNPSLPILYSQYMWNILNDFFQEHSGKIKTSKVEPSASPTAYIVTPGFNDGSQSGIPVVYINPIVGPLQPGETFTISGAAYYYQCSNTPSIFTIEARFGGVTYTKHIDRGSYSGSLDRRFSLGPFTVPDTYGIYTIDVDMGWRYNTSHNASSPIGNSNKGHINFTVGTPIDLTVGAITPTSVSQNQQVNLSVPTLNSGDIPSNPLSVNIQLRGPDYHIEQRTVDDMYCEETKEGAMCYPTSYQEDYGVGFQDSITSNIEGIVSGGSRNAIFPYTFTQLGTYSARACTDSTNVISESDENNNCGPWTAILVDEAVPTVTCTVNNQSPSAGQSVTYTATPANGATSPYSWHASDGATGLGTGSTATRSFSASGSYGMTVGASGTITDGVCPLVTVSGGTCSNPVGSLAANPSRVRQGVETSVTFNYGATGASSCTLSGPGITNQNYTATACTVTPGTYTAPITINTQGVYTLTCDGSTTKAVVNVIPKFDEF